MKLVALTLDMQAQLSTLLEEARRGQLWLDAPALAALRASLTGPGFVPMVYVGVQGGIAQGATANCEMRLLSGDYDLDGTPESDQRYLRVFQSTIIPAEHLVVADREVCESLFSDALGDPDRDDDQHEEQQAEGMGQ